MRKTKPEARLARRGTTGSLHVVIAIARVERSAATSSPTGNPQTAAFEARDRKAHVTMAAPLRGLPGNCRPDFRGMSPLGAVARAERSGTGSPVAGKNECGNTNAPRQALNRPPAGHSLPVLPDLLGREPYQNQLSVEADVTVTRQLWIARGLLSSLLLPEGALISPVALHPLPQVGCQIKGRLSVAFPHCEAGTSLASTSGAADIPTSKSAARWPVRVPLDQVRVVERPLHAPLPLFLQDQGLTRTGELPPP